MDRSEALVAARSDSWEKRAAAAELLAAVDDPEAGAAVEGLLDDEDLAVIQRAVASLLANPTPFTVGRFTSSYSTASAQDGDAMNDELRVAAALKPGVRVILAALAEQGDVGAQAALDWLS